MYSKRIVPAADNFINGNLSDFKKQLKSFKKTEIVELIIYFEEYYSSYEGFKRRLINFL